MPFPGETSPVFPFPRESGTRRQLCVTGLRIAPSSRRYRTADRLGALPRPQPSVDLSHLGFLGQSWIPPEAGPHLPTDRLIASAFSVDSLSSLAFGARFDASRHW